MEAMFQYGMIFIAGWIASMWPGDWTPLLFILSLSTMCFAKAVETHFEKVKKHMLHAADKDPQLAP